jgi:deoxyribodipyrimidine photolyase-related protein
MGALRLVLGDQLSQSLSVLSDLDRDADTVLMVEVSDETTYVPHHKKKIAFILSAMRHHAQALEDDGITVRYVRLDDPKNTGSFTGEVKRAVDELAPERLIVTEPGEWRVLQMMRDWQGELDVQVEIRDDDRFVCLHSEFSDWASARKQLRMEFFYREMRKKTGLLMDGDKPVGDAWNFDADNRKSLPEDVTPPRREQFEPDEITREVMVLVAERFDNHFGDLEPFWLAVTHDDALKALDHFVADCLPSFGDYQDAMKQGEPFLFHGLISPYLNAGLLDPIECCERAARAYAEGRAPLNAVEGFIRQILGWREYVRGHLFPLHAGVSRNAMRSTPAGPAGVLLDRSDQDGLCARRGVDHPAHAYAHHIQRLMVTGNFALLAGVDPAPGQGVVSAASMPMPMSGWRRPTPMAWRCSPTAG